MNGLVREPLSSVRRSARARNANSRTEASSASLQSVACEPLPSSCLRAKRAATRAGDGLERSDARPTRARVASGDRPRWMISRWPGKSTGVNRVAKPVDKPGEVGFVLVRDRLLLEACWRDTGDETDLRSDVDARLATPPAHHEEAAVGANVHARRSRDIQEDFLGRADGGPGWLQGVPVDLAPAPVAREQRSAIWLGPAARPGGTTRSTAPWP